MSAWCPALPCPPWLPARLLYLLFQLPHSLAGWPHQTCCLGPHAMRACRYRAGEPAVMPLDLAATAPLASVDPWTYMPPPLHHQAAGWHPDWSVPWRGWNMPPYSV